MTRDHIENIRRAAQSARAITMEPGASIKFTFRAMDIFARLVTPDAVVSLCDLALELRSPFPYSDALPSDAELADADRTVADAERYRTAVKLSIVTAADEREIDAEIEHNGTGKS